jgi:serine/threonine protein kinase
MVRRAGHGLAVDFWSLGVLIFEMLVGRSPFMVRQAAPNADEESLAIEVMSSILSGRVHWPSQTEPTLGREVRDLIRRLLHVSPSERLGCLELGIAEVMSHPWFSGFDYYGLTSRMMVPPYKPELSSAMDTSCFSVDGALFASRLQHEAAGRVSLDVADIAMSATWHAGW